MPDFTQFNDDAFIDSVETLLDEHPAGIKEHDLLRRLDETGAFNALNAEAGSSLLLFQKHFLLFHVLYSIRQQRVAEKRGALQISPLVIRVLDHVDADMQIGEVDRLSEYYLDLENLLCATEDNVNELLDAFWVRFLKNEKRGDALGVLGLSDPVTDGEIVKRYRKLASVHHPDRGGDKARIQAINEAYALLIRP
jgi:hypothetical protein